MFLSKTVVDAYFGTFFSPSSIREISGKLVIFTRVDPLVRPRPTIIGGTDYYCSSLFPSSPAAGVPWVYDNRTNRPVPDVAITLWRGASL